MRFLCHPSGVLIPFPLMPLSHQMRRLTYIRTIPRFLVMQAFNGVAMPMYQPVDEVVEFTLILESDLNYMLLVRSTGGLTIPFLNPTRAPFSVHTDCSGKVEVV